MGNGSILSILQNPIDQDLKFRDFIVSSRMVIIRLCRGASSLSDFGNRCEKIVKLRAFLSKSEEYIAIFDDNLGKNAPRMRFSQ